MAFFGMLLAILSCMALLAVTAAHWSASSTALASAAGLAQQLEGEGSQQCWEALVELKSCTSEIILYLLNGEAYLEPGCCRTIIHVIEQSCWATDAMLSVIGFTPEEGDMLKATATTVPGSMARRRSRAATHESVAVVGGRKSAPVHC